MVGLLLFLSIISIVLGHLFKVYRWKQLIETYEKTNDENLIDALSIGYLINYILPYRIGDIVRAILSGKKMKNGISFSFATIILDRIMDVIVVAILFIVFYLIGYNTQVLRDSMTFYIIFAILLIISLTISLRYNKYIKMAIKKIAGIFNEKIELSLLKLTWSFIQSLKDLLHNSNKIKVMVSTILMWGFYLLSYALYAFSINKTGNNVSTLDVFMSFFSKNNLDLTTYTAIQSYISSYTIITLIYIILPIVILLIVAFVISKLKSREVTTKEVENVIELLPHINPKDRLTFLETYFSGEKKEYFRNYIKINRDVIILKDFSAGSNATTMLCQYKGNNIFRKYSIGEDAKKLYEQILWINNHRNLLPLTNIIKYLYEDDACYYDMEYIPEAITYFNYIHSKPINESWKILESVLEDLSKKLYTTNVKSASKELLDRYIETKVIREFENNRKIKMH